MPFVTATDYASLCAPMKSFYPSHLKACLGDNSYKRIWKQSINWTWKKVGLWCFYQAWKYELIYLSHLAFPFTDYISASYARDIKFVAFKCDVMYVLFRWLGHNIFRLFTCENTSVYYRSRPVELSHGRQYKLLYWFLFMMSTTSIESSTWHMRPR